MAAAMTAHLDAPEKIAKARVKYLRTPCVLIVGAAPGDSDLRTAENRDAGAAGVQNILLAAHSMGLASYWGSCPKGANEAIAELCRFDEGTFVVALIYLGWATEQVATPPRPALTLNVID